MMGLVFGVGLGPCTFAFMAPVLAAAFGYAAQIILLAGVYFATAKLGLQLASAHPSITAVWPPTGIALAALLIWGFWLLNRAPARGFFLAAKVLGLFFGDPTGPEARAFHADELQRVLSFYGS